jgi:hypothetical protein
MSEPTQERNMTVLVTADIPVSRADVEAVGQDMGDVYDNPPEGLIVHIATETADGVHVVDVWESAEHQQRFMAERLGPSIAKVMQERGIPMDGPPPPFTITEAFDLIRGR